MPTTIGELLLLPSMPCIRKFLCPMIARINPSPQLLLWQKDESLPFAPMMMLRVRQPPRRVPS